MKQKKLNSLCKNEKEDGEKKRNIKFINMKPNKEWRRGNQTTIQYLIKIIKQISKGINNQLFKHHLNAHTHTYTYCPLFFTNDQQQSTHQTNTHIIN